MTKQTHIYVRNDPCDDSRYSNRDKLNTTRMLGNWINTNKNTTNIKQVNLESKNDNLYVHPFGNDSEFTDWGAVEVTELYAADSDSTEAISFTAEFKVGLERKELQSNMNLGLMIITCLTTQDDANAGSDYFCREYFFKEVPS